MAQLPELQAVPVITEASCDGCYISEKVGHYDEDLCRTHPCMAPYREDGRDVIWVEVTK